MTLPDTLGSSDTSPVTGDPVDPGTDPEARACDLEEAMEARVWPRRTKLVVASAVTVAGPLQFLWEALWFWADGWPTLGPFVFLPFVLAAVVAWREWWKDVREMRDLRTELEALERARLGAGSAGSGAAS